MKTPITDTATFHAPVAGRVIPVVSADFARMLEIKVAALNHSQHFAWSVIAYCNWAAQSDSWKETARNWQENVFVQDELPLTFPPDTSSHSATTVHTMQEARACIAKLETALRQATRHLSDAERLENDMIAKIYYLEEKLNETQHPNRSIGKN